jgi:formyltetrahydrofolate deformylase
MSSNQSIGLFRLLLVLLFILSSIQGFSVSLPHHHNAVMSPMDDNTNQQEGSNTPSPSKLGTLANQNGNHQETSSAPAPKLGTLRVHGPDQNGIVAAFAQFFYGHGCGIVDSEQHTDKSANLFFQRINFDYSNMFADRITLEHGIQEVCERFSMESTLNWGDKKKQVAIMVSKYDHCLWELLLRHRAGELDCDISLIVSNHPDLKPVADAFDVPFHVYKVTKDTKEAVEKEELALLKENQVDLVVLARYMQIISDNFCASYPVINIHHSFLPAFVGGKPYHRAHERGVKVRIQFGKLESAYSDLLDIAHIDLPLLILMFCS